MGTAEADYERYQAFCDASASMACRQRSSPNRCRFARLLKRIPPFSSMQVTPCQARVDGAPVNGCLFSPRRAFELNYKNEVEKRDVFLLGKRVSIDEPLQTGGGDILIVAEELLINAPIDTRVRLRLLIDGGIGSVRYWQKETAEFNAVTGWMPLSWTLSMPPWALPSSNLQLLGAKASFDSLYLRRGRYDPATKKTFIGAWPPTDEERKAGYIEVAQLPFAPVPLGSWVNPPDTASDGADAPHEVIRRDAVKSGEIRIFANKVTICPKCLESGNTFLDASGIRGGMGGAGSTHPCGFSNESFRPGPAKVACRNRLDIPGGLSGLPGKSGDGGLVHISFVNHRPSAEEIESLKSIAAVSEGWPGQFKKIRTPSIRALNLARDYEIFAGEVDIPDQKAYSGTRGELRIDDIDSDGAIMLASAFLNRAETGVNYALNSWLRTAEQKDGSIALVPTDTMQPFFDAALVDLQKQMLASIQNGCTILTFQWSICHLSFLHCHAV